MAAGGLAGAVFTAAKDAALDAFIARRIGFQQMAEVVEATLDRLSGDALMSARITPASLAEAEAAAVRGADAALARLAPQARAAS
jgi:1-deoxy-D-xylulose-5-phosphate reductoisomerase